MKTVVTAGSFIQQLFLDSAVSNIMTGKNHWVSNKHHYECQHIYKVAFVQDFCLDEKKKIVYIQKSLGICREFEIK